MQKKTQKMQKKRKKRKNVKNAKKVNSRGKINLEKEGVKVFD